MDNTNRQAVCISHKKSHGGHEKTIIAMAERSSLLNRRAEIVSTCIRDQHGISHDDINISWGIEQRSSKYKCGTRRCDLCLSEKTIIAMAERSSLLNRRAEIVSTCRHRTKFRYHMVKKKRPVQALNP